LEKYFPGKRLRDFGPASVRITLEKLGSLVPIDKEHYQRLREVGSLHDAALLAPRPDILAALLALARGTLVCS
jgi:hypothetical protein